MKTFYKLSGVIFVIGCFFFLKSNSRVIETYENGEIVIVKVIFVPNCISGKKHYNFSFNYNGKNYAKKIGGGLCDELKEGDFIRMRTNKKNSVFLYENENPYYNLISIIILFLFGVFLIYYGFKK